MLLDTWLARAMFHLSRTPPRRLFPNIVPAIGRLFCQDPPPSGRAGHWRVSAAAGLPQIFKEAVEAIQHQQPFRTNLRSYVFQWHNTTRM
jgi:hypothetical protein